MHLIRSIFYKVHETIFAGEYDLILIMEILSPFILQVGKH
jgi:hypothetical protein